MSIIERALGKLGGDKAAPAPDAAPTVEKPDSLIERAAAKIEPSAPAPAGDAPRAPALSRPASGAPAVNIDLKRLERMGFLIPSETRSQLAEEFRHIKRPLLANAFGQAAPQTERHRNLIMITSAFPGEGKTFCAINLAMSMAAELDRTVLLVDADVARPRIMEYLGTRAERGLLDVVREHRLDLGEVLLRTNVEKLSVLPAGRAHARSTELLASEAMSHLINEMASRYPDRIILFDSPPLLATSEAAVLASHMGQVILVVEADKTPTAAIKEAVSLIENSCDIIGTVLNKTNVAQTVGGYYGYGYGYGYHQTGNG